MRQGNGGGWATKGKCTCLSLVEPVSVEGREMADEQNVRTPWMAWGRGRGSLSSWDSLGRGRGRGEAGQGWCGGTVVVVIVIGWAGRRGFTGSLFLDVQVDGLPGAGA